MTGLQMAIFAGLTAGLGAAGLIWVLAPSHPELAQTIQRLTVDSVRATQETDLPVTSRIERVGLAAIRRAPASMWAKTPTRELSLLQIPVHRFYGQKVAYAVAGLLAAPALTLVFDLIGLRLPLVIPVAGTLAATAVMFVLPDIDIRAAAKRRRVEFSRALSAYIDLVALEKIGGSGSRQALERAAAISNTWVFARLSEELARSRWSGVPPWEALRELSKETDLPEVADLASIMHLGETAQVAQALRARAEAMRSAAMNNELSKANSASERMSMPMSLLGVVFMMILLAPLLLRMVAGGS